LAEKFGVTWITVARLETVAVALQLNTCLNLRNFGECSEEDLLNPSSGTEAPKKYTKARGSSEYKKNRTEKIMTQNAKASPERFYDQDRKRSTKYFGVYETPNLYFYTFLF
jgi:hypothetical protein